MKKKLVAFAVTAAMVITSAVPALAWQATGLDTSANEVVVTAASGAAGVTDENVAGTIQNGKEFKTWIDFNRTDVNSEYVLNLSGPGVTASVKLKMTKSGDNCEFVAYSAGKEVKVDAVAKGIVELTWRFFTEDNGKWLDISIDDLGSTANVEHLQDIQLRAGVENVVSLELQKSGGGTLTGAEQIVFYQDQAPEDIVSAEIVECTGETGSEYTPKTYHGNPVVATQPVEGTYYRVNTVTLDDGTVVEYEDLDKYFNIVWKATKANGTAVPTDTNFTSVVDGDWEGACWALINTNDAYNGCTITCEITPKDGTGLFNKVVVWEDSEAIAVQSRLAGDNRIETAMKVADQMKPAKGFNKIFIATASNYADALSATALAAQMDAPILLVNGNYEDEVVAYINANSAGYANTEIYVVGGTNAVSASFEKDLYKYAVNVERLSGDTRYDTNLAILAMYDDVVNDADHSEMGEILVASGTNYPDALSAAATKKPVLLVGDELTKAQRDYLQQLKADGVNSYTGPNYTIIGGTVAVSADLMAELSEKAYVQVPDVQVTRVYGDDRYETNKMVMNKYMSAAYDDATGAKHVYVACGTDFADALTGGVIAAVNDSPLVLVSPTKTNYAADVVAKVADNNGYGGLIVIGGENAVSSATVQKIA